jgi:hypothetical protein
VFHSKICFSEYSSANISRTGTSNQRYIQRFKENSLDQFIYLKQERRPKKNIELRT